MPRLRAYRLPAAGEPLGVRAALACSRGDAGCCLRKGGARAGAPPPCHEHAQPVEAQGDSAVRRGAVAERLQEETEAFLGLLFAETNEGEDLPLQGAGGGAGTPPPPPPPAPDPV